MKLSDFKLTIPDKLVAQYPEKKREKSRLMVLDRQKQTIEERVFSDIVDYIGPDDCLVWDEERDALKAKGARDLWVEWGGAQRPSKRRLKAPVAS